MMTLLEQLPLWNHAAIRVLDIRRSILQASESVQGFRLPASAFLFAVTGEARIVIDGIEHIADRCYVCHAGKGAMVDIIQVEEPFDYYFIFYKAVLVLPTRKELLRVYNDNNPFHMHYGFAPAYPLGLLTRMEQMHAYWLLDGELEKFHVRALFHHLVYDLLQQLYAIEGATTIQPDYVTQTIHYMEEYYADPLSLQDLAHALGCNERKLQRLFKEKLRIGPMEYLIQIRMNHAQTMLLNTNVPLKIIAESVGYGDSYYFSRAFKKHCGVSPLYFRQNRRISASYMSRYSIGSANNVSYNNDCDNHYQQVDGGVFGMNRSKSSVLAVSLMLSLILLLSACSTGNSVGNNSGGASPTAASSNNVSSSTNAPTAQPAYPVVIKHMKGETTLEQHPSKIAVLDTKFVDQLVTLNEQPAGSVKAAADKSDFPAYLMDKLTDVKLLGTRDEPNLEAILAMEPDLIICTEFQEEVYESLSKIAPTIMLDFNEDWRDTLATFGKIVGKSEEANVVLEQYNEKTTKLKAELKAKLGDQTVALIRPRDEGIRIHAPGHRAASILYNDLGLSAPEQVLAQTDTAYQVPLEALPEVGADHYFLVQDDMFKAIVEEFQQTDTWKNIDAVKNNQVYDVDSNVWIAYYGPIAINMVVDRVAEVFLGTP
ncbi:AraC family transcriptional regulator [Paenibacillus sinopodophylli]|uniref:AraC family transcriptional regulator n=1 Tax=Paenibacillus sinopodophylli TaxID=1837342 RepID=UPI001FE689D7|nr:AraC family transcriptional regulator [Paenibacillus sinopodophylli]